MANDKVKDKDKIRELTAEIVLLTATQTMLKKHLRTAMNFVISQPCGCGKVIPQCARCQTLSQLNT